VLAPAISASDINISKNDILVNKRDPACAALRSGDVLAATKEKYVVQFIREGLKHQLPLVNMQLKKKGMRAISFKSLKK